MHSRVCRSQRTSQSTEPFLRSLSTYISMLMSPFHHSFRLMTLMHAYNREQNTDVPARQRLVHTAASLHVCPCLPGTSSAVFCPFGVPQCRFSVWVCDDSNLGGIYDWIIGFCRWSCPGIASALGSGPAHSQDHLSPRLWNVLLTPVTPASSRQTYLHCLFNQAPSHQHFLTFLFWLVNSFNKNLLTWTVCAPCWLEQVSQQGNDISFALRSRSKWMF